MTETKDQPTDYSGQSNEVSALHEAFNATKIRFNDRAVALASFRDGGRREISFSETGEPRCVYDSQEMSLVDGLIRFAHDRHDLIDARTLPREGAPGRPGVMSKEDLKTPKDVSDYISAYGGDAYERLPLTSKPTSEIVTFEDYCALPTSEKAKILGKFGANFPATLPRKANPDRPNDQTYINSKLLEKQKKIRSS